MEEKNLAKAKEPAPTTQHADTQETQQWRKTKVSLKKRSVNPKFTLEVFFIEEKRIQGQKLLKSYFVYAASLNNAKLNLILKS